MRLAVVGAGAAAAGVLAALSKWAPAGSEVLVFDIGKELADLEPATVGSELDYVSGVTAQLRKTHGYAFPPPKSHFGQTLPKLAVDGKPRLWRSEHRGGLTTLWGGGMFPFTDAELGTWPISADDLDPYYRLIAERVGVCGEPDAMNEYFDRDYVNRPPVATSAVMNDLAATTNRHGNASEAPYRLVAGSTRLALETRPGHTSTCDYRGECMLGCPRGAIYSAAKDLDRYESEGLVTDYVRARVLAFDSDHLVVRSGDTESDTRERVGPFERIYLAANCIGSTEIVMRSLGLRSGPIMMDHAVLSFPIFYLGVRSDKADPYFSLCNLAMGGIPRAPEDEFIQFSIYPFFDHLWRYYVPRSLWRALAPFGRFARWRLLLGRVYLAGEATRRYEMELDSRGLTMHEVGQAVRESNVDRILTSVRSAVNHGGFFVPDIRPRGHGTSSHYAATLPFGNRLVPLSADGRIADNVYLTDAATFPTSPAISPTFTIMANACRVARESLEA